MKKAFKSVFTSSGGGGSGGSNAGGGGGGGGTGSNNNTIKINHNHHQHHHQRNNEFDDQQYQQQQSQQQQQSDDQQQQQSNDQPIVIEYKSDSESPPPTRIPINSNKETKNRLTPESNRMKHSDRLAEMYSRQLSASNKSNFMKHSAENSRKSSLDHAFDFNNFNPNNNNPNNNDGDDEDDNNNNSTTVIVQPADSDNEDSRPSSPVASPQPSPSTLERRNVMTPMSKSKHHHHLLASSDGFKAQKMATANQEMRMMMTNDSKIAEKSSIAQMKAKMESNGFSASKIIAAKEDHKQIQFGDTLMKTQSSSKTSSASMTMSSSSSSATASASATALASASAAGSAENMLGFGASDKALRSGLLTSGSRNKPIGYSPFKLSASTKLNELFQSMSPKMLTFSNEVDLEFDELKSIAKTFKNPIISKTESINMKGSMNKLENKMLNLCKELVQNRTNVDILLVMTEMIKKAWSVPQCGYDLGFNMSKVIRETGALEALLCNIESDDDWKIQFSSLQLLEQCLVSDNRDYVVEHGLEKVVCTAKECVDKKQLDEVIVGVGILEHMFKHSENTCKEVIKLNGLKTILQECRSTNIEVLRHCASALANLSLYGGPDSQEAMIKLKAAMWLFPLAFHNDDNIKYYACLAITVLVANQELEAEVIKSGTLDLCEPFVLSHNPEEFAKSSTSHIHGQSKNWLARLVPVLMSKREEARSLAAFHFAMEAWIKKTQEQTEIFKEINAVNALKKVASCPNAIASKYAAQALRLTGEEVPHKLSQQVPLWTIEDVKEWVKQIGFGSYCQEFEKSRVDGDLLLQLNEHMLHNDIGIENGILRKRFMRELGNLKQITDYSSCDPTNITMFLNNIGPEFLKYTYSLLNGGLDKNTLTIMNDDLLLQEFNINSTVHRMKLLSAAENLKKSQPSTIDSSKSENDPNKILDVFISYRRSNGSQLASLLKVHLQLRGFSVFLDVERLEAGKFDNNLLNSIRQAKHFLLVLTPNALDRCINDDEQKDWVHREIAQALLCKCNIIPIMESFNWPEPDQLPEDIKPICHFNGVRWIHDYQEACVDKLERFMRGDFNPRQSQDHLNQTGGQCGAGNCPPSSSTTTSSSRYGLQPYGLPPTPNTPGIRSPSQQRRSCSVENVRNQSAND